MSAKQAVSKRCASCGRTFEYQKRWAATWSNVRYCSKRCRQEKLEKRDKSLEEAILAALSNQPKRKAVDMQELAETYQHVPLERSRRAARRLAAAGKLEVLQNGQVVDPSRAKGATQLRLK